MPKWSHFESEDKKQFKTAFFDGYDIAERLLEGVEIFITIEDDGTLSASVSDDSRAYMEGRCMMDMEKVFKTAIEYAEKLDLFYHNDCEAELILVSTEGKTNIDYLDLPEPVQIGIIPGTELLKHFGDKNDT